MSPDPIKGVGTPGLGGDPVGEGLRVVVPVPHPGRRVAQGDARDVQQARVGRSERMPAHAGPVELAHRVHQGVMGAAVVPADRQVQFAQDRLSTPGERHCAATGGGLRGVGGAVAIAGAADVGDAALDVAAFQRHRLAPTHPGQEDQLGDSAPDARQALDDGLGLVEREGVLARRGRRDSGSLEGQRQVADHAAAHRMAQGGREAGVEPLDGRGSEAGGQVVVDECDQVRGPQRADGHVAHDLADALGAAAVGDQGVVAGLRVALLGDEPGVERLGDRLGGGRVEPRERALGHWSRGADVLVDLPAADPAADEPSAAARVPGGTAMPALLTETGHGAESMRSRGRKSSPHAGSQTPFRRAGSVRNRPYAGTSAESGAESRGVCAPADHGRAVVLHAALEADLIAHMRRLLETARAMGGELA